MTKTVVVKPLGLVLRKAGLVSSEKIDKALKDSLYLSQYRLGEILAIRGWIKPETAHFFAEVWPSLFQQQLSKSQTQSSTTPLLQPLGKHLQAAGLLTSNQVSQILAIQKETSAKFGKIAVEQELISSTTLEFFLEHLNLIKTKEEIESCPEAIALELDRVENHLINNHKCEASKLLYRYREVLTHNRVLSKNDLGDQQLLASGIVTLEQDYLKVTKPSYQKAFSQEWVEEKLTILRPYNKIRIKMFDLADKVNLPYKVINAVKYWTNDQVFLTQKLLQLIQEKSITILPGEEMDAVRILVDKYIIGDWQHGEAARHFRAIINRLRKQQSNSAKTFLRTHNLLKAYKRIRQFGKVKADNSLEQRELLRIGLIQLYENEISVSNLIYQAVFNLDWLKQEIRHLQSSSRNHNSQLKTASQIRSKHLKSQQLNQKASSHLVAQSTFKRSPSELATDQVTPKNQPSLFGSKVKPKVLPLIAIATSIAIIPLNVARLLTPKQPSQLLEQGNTLLEEQKYDRAVKTFDSLIEAQQKQPDEQTDLALAYNLKGKSQLKLHKYVQALATYQQALHHNPESISAKQGTGLALAGLGQEDEANRIFEGILQQSNISPEERGITWWYWGQNFCNHDNTLLANYSFKKALEFPTGFESEINSALKECDG